MAAMSASSRGRESTVKSHGPAWQVSGGCAAMSPPSLDERTPVPPPLPMRLARRLCTPSPDPCPVCEGRVQLGLFSESGV